jgi:putative DNA primase/helicase
MSTDIQHFFELLYPGVGDGYLILSWPSPTRKQKDERQALDNAWHNLATTSLTGVATRASQEAATRSVYFGVAVQHPSRQPNPFQRSQNASAYVLPGLYFDIDLAYGAHAESALPATEADALAFLMSLPAKPSLIIHTGGGLHAYWLFESPLWLLTDADRAAVTELLRQFAHTLCQAGKTHGWTLDALRDLARVLRPAGTINHKYGKPVTIPEERPVRYTEADFDWLTPLPTPSM